MKGICTGLQKYNFKENRCSELRYHWSIPKTPFSISHLHISHLHKYVIFQNNSHKTQITNHIWLKSHYHSTSCVLFLYCLYLMRWPHQFIQLMMLDWTIHVNMHFLTKSMLLTLLYILMKPSSTNLYTLDIRSVSTDYSQSPTIEEMEIVKDATSMQQSSEWGMRAFQSSSPRIKDCISIKYRGQWKLLWSCRFIYTTFVLEKLGLIRFLTVTCQFWIRTQMHSILIKYRSNSKHGILKSNC